jgi:hypothetical protein
MHGGDLCTGATTRTRTAEADATGHTALAGATDGSRHAEAAVTTATADRLHQQARGRLARRTNFTGAIRYDHTAIATTGTAATEANTDRAAARARKRERDGDIETTVATTTADGLCDDAGGVFALGQDVVGDQQGNAGARATTGTGTAEADGDRATPSATSGNAHGNGKAAIATTTTNTLREDTGGVVALRGDCRRRRGNDIAAATAFITIATEAHAYRTATGFDTGRNAHGDIEATVAATTADGLRHETRGVAT